MAMDLITGPYAILLLRLCLGVMFMAHALQKLLVFKLEGTATFFKSLGLHAWLGSFTRAAELGGSVFLILGIWSRYIALLVVPAGTVTVAQGKGAARRPRHVPACHGGAGGSGRRRGGRARHPRRSARPLAPHAQAAAANIMRQPRWRLRRHQYAKAWFTRADSRPRRQNRPCSLLGPGRGSAVLRAAFHGHPARMESARGASICTAARKVASPGRRRTGLNALDWEPARAGSNRPGPRSSHNSAVLPAGG